MLGEVCDSNDNGNPKDKITKREAVSENGFNRT